VPASQLVFGTSSQTWATNSRDGFVGHYPAGTGHAVPVGTSLALCGLTPPYLWAGDFDPGSRVLTICQRCAQLAR
jgi:hypothetical protein